MLYPLVRVWYWCGIIVIVGEVVVVGSAQDVYQISRMKMNYIEYIELNSFHVDLNYLYSSDERKMRAVAYL